MPGVLDIFNGNAFGMVSLTRSILVLPYVPARLGALGLFTDVGIETRTAMIEKKTGGLQLVTSKPWGGTPDEIGKTDQTALPIPIPHMPLHGRVDASEVQGVRAFGSATETESVVNKVNEKLGRMRQSHELTEEWLRWGAIKGIVLDGNGTTTLCNLFTTFGIGAPADVDFLLGTDTTPIAGLATSVKRVIEAALNMQPYTYIHAMCSPQFFDELKAHPAVAWSMMWVNQNEFARNDQRRGFYWQGILWEEVVGSVGGTPLLAPRSCRFFPVGVPDLFLTAMAPANFIESANTTGQKIYAKQAIEKFETGVELLTQSNVLPFCTNPGVLVKGVTSN
ncbi:MAG: major capsid protein [Phycisphaerales bacterium]